MTPRVNQSRDSLSLELWVFWFEDRHTGIIDANQHLTELEGKWGNWSYNHVYRRERERYLYLLCGYQLVETKMGSFTWDKIISSKGGSASSSPSSNGKASQQPRAKSLVSLPEEYKLFIKSVRNLVNR